MPTPTTPRPAGWGLGLDRNPQPIEGCPNCHGTGRDEAFASPCDCQSWVGRLGRTAVNRALVGEVGYATGEQMQRGHSRNGGGAGGRPVALATEPQMRYLNKLIAERPGTEVATRVAAVIARGSLTKAAASEYIDALQAAPRPQAQVAERAPVRANRYEGRCPRCRQTVAAEAGRIERNEAGKWITFHLDGECPEVEAEAPQPTVAEGNYAIPTVEGGNDLAFYRVEHGTGNWAGRVFVRLVVGGHPDRNVRRDHVAGILARIAADSDAARRYGEEIGRCYLCNHTLTRRYSRSVTGYGPDCADKHGLPFDHAEYDRSARLDAE